MPNDCILVDRVNQILQRPQFIDHTSGHRGRDSFSGFSMGEL